MILVGLIALGILVAVIAAERAVEAHRRIDRLERQGFGSPAPPPEVPENVVEFPRDGGLQP